MGQKCDPSYAECHMSYPSCRANSNQLPPASPAAQEQEHSGATVFLIGAYAKYNWPYVWVRGCMGRASQTGTHTHGTIFLLIVCTCLL